LPVGVPLEQQQYHALMHENGALEVTDQAEMAKKIGALILPR
jgi:hypothetical protein